MTKREKFEKLVEILSAVGTNDTTYTAEVKEELVEFVKNEITLIDKRHASDQERAAKRKELGDEVRALVKSYLDAETEKSADDILAEIGDKDLTHGIVQSRLNQLVTVGEAAKKKVATSKGNKTVYTLA